MDEIESRETKLGSEALARTLDATGATSQRFRRELDEGARQSVKDRAKAHKGEVVARLKDREQEKTGTRRSKGA